MAFLEYLWIGPFDVRLRAAAWNRNTSSSPTRQLARDTFVVGLKATSSTQILCDKRKILQARHKETPSMERLYETSTMDSPVQSDDDSARPAEEKKPALDGDDPVLEETRTPALSNENLSASSHEELSSVGNESFMNVQPRPRSPSAFSELSRPDPPSIVDHRVLDDLNDDDWEEPEGEAAAGLPPLLTRGSSTGSSPGTRRGSEHNVEGKFIQKALATKEMSSDETGPVATETWAGQQQLPASDLASSSKDTFSVMTAHPERSPQDILTEDHCHPEEPPAVLQQSISTTNLRLLKVISTPEATVEDSAVAAADSTTTNATKTEECEEVDRQKQEPPAISPDQPYKKGKANGASSEERQSTEATPTVANGRALQHQNSFDPHPLASPVETSEHGDLASPTETWMDAAQTISPTQMEVPMWTAAPGAAVSTEACETASEPERMTPTRSLMVPGSTPIHDDQHRQHRSISVPPHQHWEPQMTLAPGPAFAPTQQHETSSSSYGESYAQPRFRSTATGGPPFLIPNASGTAAPQDNGRRKIHLHMQEEVQQGGRKRSSFLGHFRTRSQRIIGMHSIPEQPQLVSTDRGLLSVSWFPGTSAIELQEHVRRSVIRKLQLPPKAQLVDLRLLDESMNPAEEIVLSPHIPSGSTFTLRFSVNNDGASTPGSVLRPPDSPSAAPSHQLAGLSNTQVEALTQQLDELRTPMHGDGTTNGTRGSNDILRPRNANHVPQHDRVDTNANEETGEDGSRKSDDYDMTLHSEDPIEARLRQITELLLDDRQRKKGARQEKRQVIFVLMNYFILFLGLIALSAELQARAPEWLSSLEKQFQDVRDCSADQEALFECVSRGDFAGLVASVVLYLSRSVIPRRIFLFGFESPKKLWTVVYESLVTAFCWGCSYLFIRRGMNADTRERFLQKYWKDAVYGSLAGFNAAFMKQVLKNLIPQEAVEDVLRDRRLKFLSWLPSFE